RRNIGASSHAAVWGRYDAAAHRRWRDPAARIFETGSMRRDLGEAAELGQRRCTLKSARTLRSTVLVITAEYGSDLMAYGGIAGTEEVLSWWEGLCALSVRQTGWDWRLKMHPRFDRAVFYRYVLSAQSHRLEQVSGELVAALETADVMLLMVNPSTSAAHAILAGVPVVYFKPASTPESWASPLEKGGASVVSDFAGLESELKRLFGDAVYRQQVVVTQRAFLDRALVAVGEASVEKARGALDELIRSRAAAKGPDAAARWLLDLLMIVDYGMRGALGWPAFRDRLRELGRRGKKLTFEHLPGIQTADLADMLMNITLVAIWWRPEQERRIGKNRPWLGRILWRVYRALPDSIRPLPIWLLPYLRRTLEEEPLFNTDSRFWRWIGSRNPTVSRGPPIPDRQM
ncbi:MAG: hypothetical protein KJ726_07605, partial [Verrucomicrobia bacterium]|nr:hypothetical protein [Verrucomicrobiota bacterium]